MRFLYAPDELGLDPACVSACPTEALKFGDVENADDPVVQIGQAFDAKPFRQAANTKPVVRYVKHDTWMEKKVNLGIQLSPDDEDVIYEQGNLG